MPPDLARDRPTPEPGRLEPAGAVLLVMDFQNDLVHPEGAFRHWGIPYRVAEAGVIPRLVELREAARSAQVPVVYTAYVVREATARTPPPSPFFDQISAAGAMREGTWGGRIHDDLAPADNEIVIAKWRPNPFLGTELETVLRGLGARTLILTGIVTEWVVEEAARHGAAVGYRIVVAADCCESARDHFRDHSLRRILPQLGEVLASRAIAERLSRTTR